VPALLITGNRTGAGKTSLAAALLAHLHRSGRRGAYWKPFSDSPETDADVRFAAEVLSDPLGLSPVPPPIPQTQLPLAGDGLRSQYSSLQGQADVVLIEVPEGGKAAELADALDVRVLRVHAYSPGEDPSTVGASAQQIGGRLAGLVVNAVPIYRRDGVAAELVSQNLPSTTVIPESRFMLTVTVEQIAAHLGGEWVLDPVNIEAPVERYLIGGNIMDSGPTYFGRFANQAVIARVQRPDIHLASMGAETRCLVLTGPGEANEYIKAEARERDIPLIRVQSSTLDTAEALGSVLGQGTVHSLAKAQHFAELLTRYASQDVVEGWLS
jgi:BioD-like phosphotransacetylase family protein